jgi:hypothetical protein
MQLRTIKKYGGAVRLLSRLQTLKNRGKPNPVILSKPDIKPQESSVDVIVKNTEQKALPFLNDFLKNAKILANQVMDSQKESQNIKDATMKILDTTGTDMITKQFLLGKTINDRFVGTESKSEKETDAAENAKKKEDQPQNIEYYINMYNVNKIKESAKQSMIHLIDIEKTDKNIVEGTEKKLAEQVIRRSNRSESAKKLAETKSLYDKDPSEQNKTLLEEAINHALNNLVFFDMVNTYKVILPNIAAKARMDKIKENIQPKPVSELKENNQPVSGPKVEEIPILKPVINLKWNEKSKNMADTCITTMKDITEKKSDTEKRLLFQNLANDLNILLMTM